MVFVTGGTGLIGGYLLKALVAANQEVRALYRTHYPLQLSEEERHRVEWIHGDILDVVSIEEAMKGCHSIYHCAGLVSFNPRKKQALNKINIEGTANVVNAALQAGVKRIVHISSVSALGRRRDNQTLTEDAKWEEEANLSHYGRSKFLSEVEVWRGFSEGLTGVIVNPSIVLGVGDWSQGSIAIFKNAYQSFPWYTEGVTGFVDAADVARAMMLLMDSDITGERFIISAENRTFREVITAIARGFNKKPPHLKATAFLSGFVWRWEKVKSMFTREDPLLTKEIAETAQIRVMMNNSKILKYLPGFQFKPLQETIDQYTREYLANLNG